MVKQTTVGHYVSLKVFLKVPENLSINQSGVVNIHIFEGVFFGGGRVIKRPKKSAPEMLR